MVFKCWIILNALALNSTNSLVILREKPRLERLMLKKNKLKLIQGVPLKSTAVDISKTIKFNQTRMPNKSYGCVQGVSL